MPSAKRVIFVDDESRVLDGIRRMLRPMAAEFEMAFVGSGQDALKLMAQAPFDVIVSDIRMPGMSGVELLKHVAREYPSTIRIVLSGQADRDSIVHSVGPIHQYLSKPCDAETIKSTVRRMCNLSRFLADNDLVQLVCSIESLPSLPSLYNELLEKLKTPDIPVREVGDTIARDLGMTTKVLQLVNSAFFGVKRHITNPTQAVNLLGLETVRALVVSLNVFSQFPDSSIKSFSYDRLIQHSAEVATFGKRLATSAGIEGAMLEDCFMAGLLHDVGQVVLASKLPDKYQQVVAHVRDDGMTMIEAEKRIYSTTHAEIGSFLLGLWGFSNAVVEAVAFHHNPRDSELQGFSPVVAVYVAEALCEPVVPSSTGRPRQLLDEEYLGRIGLSERVPAWLAMAQQSADKEHCHA